MNSSLHETPDAAIKVLPMSLRHFDELPNSAYVNADIVCALEGNISKPTLWRRINDGQHPPADRRSGPRQQGPRDWRVGTIRRHQRGEWSKD